MPYTLRPARRWNNVHSGRLDRVFRRRRPEFSMSVPRLFTLVLVCAAAGGSAWAIQGAPPTIPSELVSTGSPLGAAQRETLAKFIEHWIARMNSGEADQVADARNQLAQVPRTPGATAVFRSDYGRIVTEKLKPLLTSSNDLAATNAMTVLAALRTTEAIDALVSQIDLRVQPAQERRLTAASMLAKSVGSVEFSEAKAASTAREIAANVRSEASWIVVHQELEALAALAPKNKVNFKTQIDAIGDVVSRIDKQGTPSDLMQAVSRALAGLFKQYLDKPINEQKVDGPILEPVVLSLLKTIDRHWDAAQKSEQSKRDYGDAIQRGEGILKRTSGVTGRSAPASPPLHEAWSANDRSKYTSGVSSWESFIKGG